MCRALLPRRRLCCSGGVAPSAAWSRFGLPGRGPPAWGHVSVRNQRTGCRCWDCRRMDCLRKVWLRLASLRGSFSLCVLPLSAVSVALLLRRRLFVFRLLWGPLDRRRPACLSPAMRAPDLPSDGLPLLGQPAYGQPAGTGRAWAAGAAPSALVLNKCCIML